ncbi:MAG: tyrosine--tRNA ligase [Candidatus Brocadiia bacterium]
MFAETAVQLKQIERGVAEIFPREDLVSKLEKSRRENRPLRIKLGIDPTSSDIHLGHAVPLNKLKHFQDLGHQVVLIIGDYTGMVGDPSGRDATRPQLTHEAVMQHAQTYLDQVGKVLDRARTEVVYNGDWFSKMSFLDVIRLAAKATVARILERDDFLKRYKAGEPISLHEFMYPLMQGHDSVMVRADVEIGGTDQRFNLLVGRQFQKDAGQEPQVALTLPLLVGTDGVQKMSKSYGNYIGISEPPAVMFGKTMSVPDALLRSYFDLASDLPAEQVERLLAGDPMKAKLALACAIVERYHGADAAREAAARFDREVRHKEAPADVPEVRVPPELLADGKIWIARLIVHCGMAASTSEAKRLVEQGAVSMDGQVVTDSGLEVAPHPGFLLKAGKRKFARVTAQEKK